MKQSILLIFILICTLTSIAQDVDYVISDPSKEEKKQFRKPSQNDSISIPNPDYTNYFITATAFTLDKKKIRLSGTDIFFVKGSYGLTDNTMISVNLSLMGTAAVSLKQKINLNDFIKAGFSVSGGSLIFSPSDPNVQGNDTNAYFAGGQVLFSLGDKQDNLTVGSSFYYIKSTFDMLGNGKIDYTVNNVFIGLQKQIGKKFYLIAEGIYVTNHQVFTGAIGAKLIMGEKMALNFGLMPFGGNDPGTNQTYVMPVAIPLISFRLLLGKN